MRSKPGAVLGMVCLVLVCAVANAVAVRGSFRTGGEPTKRYPGDDWQSTTEFCKLYDFGYATNNPPFIFGGFSSSGNEAQSATCANAANALCATPTSSKHDGPCASASDVPMMFVQGQGDYGSYNVTIAQQCNAQGMRQSVEWDRGAEHVYCDARLAFLFYAECIRLRYPPGSSGLKNTPREKGWLGDMDQARSWDTDCPYIAHYARYGRDKTIAAWLPTRYFAFCWRGFVIGKNNQTVAPITITTPSQGAKWNGWPRYDQGDSVRIVATYSSTLVSAAIDRFDICDGDNVIESLKRNPYGVYQTKWKAVAGFHGILAVAYKDGSPVAVSRPVTVIVGGTVQYSAVDLDDTALVPPPRFGAATVVDPTRPLTIARTNAASSTAGAQLYYVNGRTLMPGRVRAHCPIVSPGSYAPLFVLRYGNRETVSPSPSKDQ